MRYLIGLLILLFLTLLSLRVSLVRAAIVLITGGVLLLGYAALVETRRPGPALSQLPADQQALKQAAAAAEYSLWRAIRPDQIVILSQSLAKADPADEEHGIDYAATIENPGERDLDMLKVRIRLYDCPGKPSASFEGCFTIGDNTQTLAARIAAHGRGDISGHFIFPGLRKGTNQFAWRPEIAAVHAAP